MADQERNEGSATENGTDNSDQQENNLSDFVMNQYRQQKNGGSMNDDSVSEERANNFFARAFGESQRMSTEVEKSYSKIAGLHAELGAENFASWRAEHSDQVLSPQQMEAVEKATHHTDQL